MKRCQLEKKLCFILFYLCLVSCAEQKIIKARDESPLKYAANWFKVDQTYSFRDKDDAYLLHPFYDIDPITNEENVLRFVPLNNVGAHFGREIDLVSGRLYRSRNFCKTDDVSNQYSGKISYPNFMEGFIPKRLNEIDDIQKIIVFTGSDSEIRYSDQADHFEYVKIIGSLLISKCSSFPCDLKEKWKTYQLLVGVDGNSTEMKNIFELDELKNIVDWNYTKSFLLNEYGIHQLGQRYFPKFKIKSEMGATSTRQYFQLNSKKSDILKEQNFQKSCFQLYDEVWNNLQKIRSLSKLQKEGFYDYFKNLQIEKSQNLFECFKKIRSSNINLDSERHWTFAFIEAYIKLINGGLYYSCNDQSWLYNPENSDGRRYFDPNKEIKHCNVKSFEMSFDHSINGLLSMKNQQNYSYRYIEYDTRGGGTHQKIYSWIIDERGQVSCDIPNSEMEIFPQDVIWNPFKEDEAKTVR